MSDPDAPGYVLVVEDSTSMRKMLEMMVKQLGFEVFGVGDGVEAVQEMLKRPPLLVLLDLELPTLDGIAVLNLLRKHTSLKDIPVIACTAHAERETVMRAIKAGVSDYICKPIDRRVLKEKVEKYLPAPEAPAGD